MSLINRPTTTYSVTVNIVNIRNKKGRIQVQVYKDQATFAKETPWKTYYVSKDLLKDNSITYVIEDLNVGLYGFALLDDENSDKKMDYGWLMPKEGFGFSDYFHTGWSRPTFYDFKFFLKEDRKVVMKIRYV